MAEQEYIDDPVVVAVLRSRVYAMLASAFVYPTQMLYSDIETGAYADSLTETATALYPDLEDQIAGLAVTLCAATSLSEQEADYLRTFETGLPKPAVPLYEGMSARPAERAAILLELKAFFSEFGLTMNKALGEFEDNLTAELEFMQFLAAKEAEAIQNGSDRRSYQLAQHDFLTRHLNKWLPGLGQSASEIQSSFYRSAVQIAAMFVQRDVTEAIHGLQIVRSSPLPSQPVEA